MMCTIFQIQQSAALRGQKFQSPSSQHIGSFHLTATTENQGSVTCYSWPFRRKSHPQVEPLLASYCNRVSSFMIDIFTCQICHISCIKVPYFQKKTKGELKVCQSKCHCCFKSLGVVPFWRIYPFKGRAKQSNLGLPWFQFKCCRI